MWKNIFSIKPKKEIQNPYYGDYVGAVCQVMSDENKIYFIGQIDDYSSSSHEMRISVYKGDYTPQGVIHEAPVKMHVQNRKDVVVLFGVVTGQTAGYWRVKIKNMIQCVEQRDSFRQNLDCEAKIIKHDKETGKENTLVCDLMNISLTGIAFRSDEVFEVGERISIDEVVLYENCNTKYSFKCIVKRTFKDDNDKVCYGCEFERIPSSVENNLCKDIFYLQSQSINGN